MKRYGVIMAGGGGTRFWPLSRKARPKQFLNLTGKDILVNETIDRLPESISREDVFIVTNAAHAKLTLEETAGRVREDHILAEPAARNTAACIGYAAMEIVRKYEDGVMCILPSDSYIRNVEEYRSVIDRAAEAAEKTDRLVTIGIKPTFPSTGYGYIKRKEAGENGWTPVEEFVEKPGLETARAYLEDGSYLWNSGMFVWRASTILRKLEALLPDIYACLQELGEAFGSPGEKEALERIYPAIPKISIDYGIMERSKDVLVLEGDFGWNDVGSFDALEALYEADENGNLRYGEFAGVDARNCICYSDNKLIAAVGVEDLIVVNTEDAVLVCRKDRAQDVKEIVEELRTRGKEEYL